jgi:hypothetical protein
MRLAIHWIASPEVHELCGPKTSEAGHEDAVEYR